MHFVGSTIHHHDNGKSIKAMVEKLGITKYVRLPKQDFLAEQEYQDYLVAADLGIQLRTYDFLIRRKAPRAVFWAILVRMYQT